MPMLLTTSTLLLLAALTATPDEPQAVTLTLVPTGAAEKAGLLPLAVTVTETKPEQITKAPDDLKAPKYAVLKFGSFSMVQNDGTIVPFASGAEGGKSPIDGPVFTAILDEPEGSPTRVFIDTNRDGNLTNDPAPEWTGHAGKNPDGSDITTYVGKGDFNLGTADAPRVVKLGMYRFDKKDQVRAVVADKLVVYRDYFTKGEVKFGEKTMNVMLTDDRATGDFRGIEPPAPPPAAPAADAPANPDDQYQSGVTLLIDVNGNDKIDFKGEAYDARKPFNIGGTTYELANIAPDGTGFKLVKSSKSVDEVTPPPDHEVGKKITAFEATLVGGKTVKFPGDYKGKIVLIDFWATWCGPCMREVPNVVAAYDKHHAAGFEVLGVSLDQPDQLDKVKRVTEEKKMVWPQIYEGTGWQSKLAGLYAIRGIPACWLVDGDTGLIIADESRLRGPQLIDTVDEALKNKAQAKN